MTITKPIAVISDPRSGSRNTNSKYVKETGNPYGGIHYTYHISAKCLSLDKLQTQNYTLHGHWYSLHKINSEVITYVNENYEIVTIERNHLHRFLSCALVIHTKDINFSYKIREIPLNIVDEYFKIMLPSRKNKSLVTINKIFTFDNLFGEGASLTQYQKNYSSVINAKELIDYYLQQYEVHGPC